MGELALLGRCRISSAVSESAVREQPRYASGNSPLSREDLPAMAVAQQSPTVRLTLDQRTTGEWNGIDAVRLLGYRIN